MAEAQRGKPYYFLLPLLVAQSSDLGSHSYSSMLFLSSTSPADQEHRWTSEEESLRAFALLFTAPNNSDVVVQFDDPQVETSPLILSNS